MNKNFDNDRARAAAPRNDRPKQTVQRPRQAPPTQGYARPAQRSGASAPRSNVRSSPRQASPNKTELEMTAEMRAYRAEMLKFILKYAAVALGLGLALALILFGFISCNFYTGLTDGGEENFTYTVELFKNDPEQDGEKTVIEHKDAFINGGVYIPLSALKQYSEYTLAGDADSVSVIYGSTGGEAFDNTDKAEFLIDSNCVRVNKNRVTLDVPILFIENELRVPYEFIKLYMSGFTFEEEQKGKHITYRISRNAEPIGYRLMESSSEFPPIETEFFPEAVPNSAFNTDLSSYEEYMTSDDIKYLALANNSSRLKEDYDPGELIDINYTLEGRGIQKLERNAAMSLEAMLKEAAAEGLNSLYVTTGFRSYANQKAIYDPRYEENKKVHGAARAEAETIKTVSYPGASDHQTGFGFNFDTPAGFETSAEYAWLINHCADFGFILRYPKDKEDITGVEYESGHFRFVGRYHAQNIMREGICLEEYLEKYASTLN